MEALRDGHTRAQPAKHSLQAAMRSAHHRPRAGLKSTEAFPAGNQTPPPSQTTERSSVRGGRDANLLIKIQRGKAPLHRIQQLALRSLRQGFQILGWQGKAEDLIEIRIDGMAQSGGDAPVHQNSARGELGITASAVKAALLHHKIHLIRLISTALGAADQIRHKAR